MLDKHLIVTFKDVFEQEIDRNEASGYEDINENCRFWLAKLPMIIEAMEAEIEARLRGLEWQLARELGLDKLSGGFVAVAMLGADETRDKLFYKLSVKHGVQSDCEDRVETCVAWLDPVTMKVTYEEEL